MCLVLLVEIYQISILCLQVYYVVLQGVNPQLQSLKHIYILLLVVEPLLHRHRLLRLDRVEPIRRDGLPVPKYLSCLLVVTFGDLLLRMLHLRVIYLGRVDSQLGPRAVIPALLSPLVAASTGRVPASSPILNAIINLTWRRQVLTLLFHVLF